MSQPRSSTVRVPLAGGRWLLLPALVLVAAAVAAWTWRLEHEASSRLPVTPAPRYDPARETAEIDDLGPAVLDAVSVPQPVSIGRGQTLGGMLADLGLAHREIHAAVSALPSAVDVRKILPGETGVAYFDPEGGLSSLRLHLSGKGQAELRRRGGTWAGSWQDFEREIRVRRVAGELRTLLESDIQRAGGRPALAYSLSDVLQWDLDFNRDLRVGDRFRVLYEEVTLDGAYHGIGRILAVDYENQGRRIQAFRYGDGYYDSEGRPLRKMFLRSPMRFTRVTSRFSHRRFHPVLKVHRPHYGVDYGAPRGTPVRVTASGVVIFAGRSGGAGKMVKVRHPNDYVTAYLHLSGYGPGVRSGKRLSQGDIVGYVGSTGLSTAPHLDYRVQKNGRWIDPLKLKSEPAEPVPRDQMERFLAERDRLLNELGETSAAPPRLAASPTAEPMSTSST